MVEEDSVGRIARLQPAESVCYSEDVSRHNGRRFDRGKGRQANVLYGARDRDVQGKSRASDGFSIS
jgi:hypothetical protein